MPETNNILKRLLKKSKGLFIAGALVFGLYHAMAPDVRELDDNKSYAPNSIQQEFMRLAAQKYDYLALGDTDHRRAEIDLFALSQETVGAVSAGGDDNYFLETSESRQGELDALRDKVNKKLYQGKHSWICSKNAKDRMSASFSKSVRDNEKIHFIAADKRQADDSAMKSNVKFSLLINLPFSFYKAVYGCIDKPALILLNVMGDIGGMGVVTDDRPTTQFILTHKEGGTILFGAGHFNDRHSVTGKHSMARLLKDAGKSIAVFNIYADPEQRKSKAARSRYPDAYLYVTPPPGEPDGVHINNPAFQGLYKQAVENVRQKETGKFKVAALNSTP